MQENEVVIAIVGSILLFFSGTVLIIVFLFRALKRKHEHREALLFNERKFQSELAKAEIETQEQTRKNLASDLHDNIGQLLSLTNVTLGSINLEEKEKAVQKIKDVQQLVTRSIRELRQLSKIIHGEQSIQQGLVRTIEQEIAWLQRNGFYTVKFICDDTWTERNHDKDLLLYRLLQESLNNAIKHSSADVFEIGLKYEDGNLQLSISDNGTGFDVDEAMKHNAGLGLVNMQRRVQLLNGSMNIESSAGEGTQITFIIPYP